MSKCKNCGKELSDEWKACPFCGAAVERNICPSCGKTMDPAWVACPFCGAALKASPQKSESQFQFDFSEDTASIAAAFDKQIEKSERERFSVVLKSIGNDKIAVIKAVMGLTGMGLAEAKNAVESVGVLAENLSESDAEYFASSLRKAGADAETLQGFQKAGCSAHKTADTVKAAEEMPVQDGGILSKDEAGYLFGKMTTESLKRAYPSIKYYAEKGDAEFQNYLAFYYDGAIVKQNVVKPDEKTCFYWFKKSAEQGNANSQYFVGEMYYEGIGCECNKKEGIAWLKKSAAQGECLAQFYLEDLGIEY